MLLAFQLTRLKQQIHQKLHKTEFQIQESKSCLGIRFYHHISFSKHLFNGQLNGSKRLNIRIRTNLIPFKSRLHQLKAQQIIIGIFIAARMSFLKYFNCKSYPLIQYRIKSKINHLNLEQLGFCTREYFQNFMISVLRESSCHCFGEKAFFNWILKIDPFNIRSRQRLPNYFPELL